MEFTRKKLPKEAAEDFKNVPIQSVRTYALVYAPAYVFMRANEKFVAVKAPLDFFTPEELERLSTFESLFFPRFIDTVENFCSAGRRIRAILGWSPEGASALALAPFELSDAVLRVIGPLWGPPLESLSVEIEPLFISALVGELCGQLSSETLRLAREKSVVDYEHSLLLAAWSVFLSLHLGHCDVGFLSRLYSRSFDHFWGSLPMESVVDIEERELWMLARESYGMIAAGKLDAGIFAAIESRMAQKLVSRLARVQREFSNPDLEGATIFGIGGIIDA